ncbi:MAG: ATP-binding protein [Candidatus Delongbacteria bacterium]|nr:ATP-binding protein [Candidatus Delongbacteria bacterium]
MKRDIEKYLLDWKNRKDRKVLLVRGARQVGKTYSVRSLGKIFDNYLEVNFEENREIHNFFSETLSPQDIVKKLSLYFQQSIIPGKTLLFFDEIQANPDAIRSLRFFYEKMPELHLVAAGSLLEFALAEVSSFGVGRIESFFMYPMNFYEYLHAIGAKNLVQLIKDSGIDNPIDNVIHNKILDHLKTYQIIGGLPEVVNTYVNGNDLIQCQSVLDNLILGYTDDFAKYRVKSSPLVLDEVFKSIALQAGNKFKYSNISKDKSSTYKTALNLLVKAGIAYKIYHTSAQGLPLGAQIKHNKFKVVMFDTGIYQRISKLDLSSFAVLDYNSLINKGALAELYVCNELISTGNIRTKPEIFYWHREARGSNAEIDYVISVAGKIIPIEVKAGTRGAMQSLHLFLKERNLNTGIRFSGENYGTYDNILSIPAYAVSNIHGRKFK